MYAKWTGRALAIAGVVTAMLGFCGPAAGQALPDPVPGALRVPPRLQPPIRAVVSARPAPQAGTAPALPPSLSPAPPSEKQHPALPARPVAQPPPSPEPAPSNPPSGGTAPEQPSRGPSHGDDRRLHRLVHSLTSCLSHLGTVDRRVLTLRAGVGRAAAL